MFKVDISKDLSLIVRMRQILGCSQEVFARINRVSLRNVIRWEKNRIRPGRSSIKKLNKLEELCKELLDTFKSKRDINGWLKTPNDALEGRTPIQEICYAKTQEEGINRIISLLGTMEWGIYT